MLKRISLLATLFFLSLYTIAEIRYNSPYSNIGLGDVQYQGLGYNRGMGDLGISNSNKFFVNLVNPALIQRSEFTSFEFGIRFVGHKLKTPELNERTTDGRVDYFALSFPVSKRYGMAFGILPVTDVNYNYTVYEGVEGSEDERVRQSYSGEGGLGKLYWAHGVDVFNREKDLDTVKNHTTVSLGAEANYIFGNIDKNSSTKLETDGELASSSLDIISRTTYRDFNLRTGLAFRQSLNVKKNQLVVVNDTVSYLAKKKRFTGLYVNFGATYDFGADMNGRGSVAYEHRGADGSIVEADTVEFSGLPTTLPKKLGLGFSIDRLKPEGKNAKGERRTAMWALGSDIYLTDWSTFKGIQEGVTYEKGYKVIFGAELAPDLYNMNRDKKIFLKRYIYKMGVSYEVLPYKIQNKNVTELSFSAGATLPLGQLYGKALANQAKFINLAFRYVLRRTDATELDNDYWQISASFTLNHKWFVRRKYGI